jgi:hypothetical protein
VDDSVRQTRASSVNVGNTEVNTSDLGRAEERKRTGLGQKAAQLEGEVTGTSLDWLNNTGSVS